MNEDQLNELKRPFQKGDMKFPLFEESSFAILFPHYREKYLTENLKRIEDKFDSMGIKIEINFSEGIMTVKTTDKTWDPVSIIKARDCIKLLSRSVPIEQAFKVFEEDIDSQIMIIGREIRNQERFIKRRQRLLGPNGATLKALELLTNCYILVQGHTVSIIGPLNGIHEAEKVINDCMNNIHPVYHIKTLMIKRELQKNPELAKENWDRYLPKFKKSVSHSKKPKIQKNKKKNNNILPDYPKDTELDRQIESGEYFLKKKTNQKRKNQKNKENKIEPDIKSFPNDIKIQKESEINNNQISTKELINKINKK